MNEPADPAQEAHNRLDTALKMAVVSIRWERLWRVIWAPLAVIVLFVGIALSDVLTLLPDILHAVILAGLAVLLGYSAGSVRAALAPISREQASHRVEIESGLKHRPLTALMDRPTHDKLSPGARALWEGHVLRAQQAAKRVLLPTPKPGIAALDQRGLRFVPVLVLFVGVLMGGNEPADRLMRALTPIGDVMAPGRVMMDVWITPPAYTGLAPVVFSALGAGKTGKAGTDAADAPEPELIVPVGSQIMVHATDAETRPVLRLGKVEQPLDRLGGEDSLSYKLEAGVDDTAVGAERLSIMIGVAEFAGWPVRIAADTPPSIEFERAPGKRRDTQLDVAYIAGDDYGVKSIEMRIRRPNGRPVPGGEAEILADVPISGDRRAIKASTSRDFSAHPWAGLPVTVRLIATDTAGQTAETEAFQTVLPERIFNHPIARALAETRKKINDPDPGVLEAAANEVHNLLSYPKRFFDDTVVFLAIKIAANRLGLAKDDSDVPGVQRLLWETALRIEDGEFALAEADLMRLQEEAMQALRDGQLGEELNQVMRELQQAMDRYMEALAERMQEMGIDQLPTAPDQAQMQTQDMQDMMDRIRELAETGNREAAEKMLAQMQQMLEQLRQGMQMQQNNPAMAEAKKTMDQLRALTEEQQQLLDRTFQENRRDRNGAMQRPQQGGQQQGQQQGQKQGNQQGNQQGQQGTPSAAEQEALRRRLGELMMQMDEALGQIPDNLGRAERQMEQAGKNLGKGEFRDAAGNQSQALQELRDATNQMAEAMARQFGQQMGVVRGNQPMPGGQGGFDPFGRRSNDDQTGQGTAVEDGDVTLPGRMELRRAREILDELRRRSGDRERPRLELDYIDRLLDIF